MADPRRHHYVPQCYLANFTDSGDKNGNIGAFDKAKNRTFRTGIGNVAHVRDFYRLDPNEEVDDEFAVETSILAPVEGNAKPIIDQILRDKRLPESPEALAHLWIFFGFLAMRVPSIRRQLESFVTDIGRTSLQMIAANASPAYLDNFYRAQGIPPSEQISFDEFKEFALSDRYTIGINQGYLISLTLEQAPRLAELLAERHWCIGLAADSGFITSDRPVTLRWSQPVPGSQSPGFGLGNTEVRISLSPSICLIGSFDPLPEVADLDHSQVAHFNADLVASADRFLFFRDENFRWADEDGVSRSVNDLLGR